MNDEVFTLRYTVSLVQYSLFLFGSGSYGLGYWTVEKEYEILMKTTME